MCPPPPPSLAWAATTFVTLPGTKKISSFGRGDKKSILPLPRCSVFGYLSLPSLPSPPKKKESAKNGGEVPNLGTQEERGKPKNNGESDVPPSVSPPLFLHPDMFIRSVRDSNSY